MIVVLSLVAIFGMLALTIDVGGLLTLRRNLVRGADAASLAAAGSCARNQTDAVSQADTYARANQANAVRTQFRVTRGSCPGASGRLEVSYQSPKQLFFAPIIGKAASETVSATSTAAWGAAVGAAQVTPIMLDSSRLRSPCNVPNTAIGTRCVLWYDEDGNNLQSSQWGLMNLDLWNVSAGLNCSNAGASSGRSWITNGYPSQLTMAASPNPTYVCADGGSDVPVWTNSLASQIGKIKLFPVNDASREIMKSGKIDKFAIVGFTSLKIINVYKGNDAGVTDTTQTTTTNYGCTGTKDFKTNGTLSLNGFGTQTAPTSGGPCPAASTDTIGLSDITLKKTSPSKTYKGCASAGKTCDYLYNASTHVITWLGTVTPNVTVTFKWSRTTSTIVPGICGQAPDNTPSNAYCIETEWRGYSTTPGPVGNGEDFGIKSVQLVADAGN